MTTRIATFPYQQRLLGQSLRTQQSMLELQVQVSTGKTSQDFTGIAQDSFRLVSLKGTQARAIYASMKALAEKHAQTSKNFWN